jgi:steroid delta-isomerase-like uncharacterized protein
MSTEDNKASVRRFFEEVCNGRDLQTAEALFDPEFVLQEPRSVSPGGKGISAIQNEISIYHKGIPDAQWIVHEVLAAENDKVIARWTGQGTHTGDLAGIPPTGRKVSVEALTLFTCRNGKIIEMIDSWDALSMMQQLGLAPQPGQAVS